MSQPLPRGLAGFLAARQQGQQEENAELQQAGALQQILAGKQQMQERSQAIQREQALRDALAASNGDPEKALEIVVRRGDLAGAAKLAPIVKIHQERKQAEETKRGLAALLAPEPEQSRNPMVPGPGASVMAGSGAVTPSAQPAPNPTQARISHLNKLAGLYATNPVVVQRIQAEIDKLQRDADKTPAKRELISGETLIQQERQPDGSWKEIGRGPRFAKQVAPVVKVGGEDPVSVTDDTLEMDAWRYLTDGTLPTNMGRGVQGSQQATKIRNRAAALAKDMGMTPDEIRFAQLNSKTQVQAIGQLAKARAQILQFEKTAEYNADLALNASKDVWRTGSPLVNKPVQWIRENATGDPKALVFNAATETFVSEYARVMSGGYGAAQTTEGAQTRAHKLLNTAHTDAQFDAVIKQLKVEMKNRVKALNDQMEEEKKRLRDGVVRPKPGEPTPTPSPAAPSTSGWSITPVTR